MKITMIELESEAFIALLNTTISLETIAMSFIGIPAILCLGTAICLALGGILACLGKQ